MGNSCCSDGKAAQNRDTLPQIKKDPNSKAQAKLEKKRKRDLHKKGLGPTAEALSTAYIDN
jgi:hypothetical protein